MKIFIGTSNILYQKRLIEVLQDDELHIMSSEREFIDILHNTFNWELLENNNQDYTLILVDYDLYKKINLVEIMHSYERSHCALVLLCDRISSVNLDVVFHTKTALMLPMDQLENREIKMEIQLLTHNVYSVRKIQDDATLDSLTQILNRRCFIQKLENFFYDYKKFNKPFCLAFIDLDYFKVINDTFGHLKGDEVLASIAKIMKDNCRKTDILGRIGGEEFAIIFQDTKLTQAFDVLERIRIYVECTDEIEDILSVTLSAGLVASDTYHHTYEDLIQEADLLLYKAKDLGRNRICL
ncbi:MAG: GGDEF domain-containing protein [Brevinema sp.]